jgi:N-sulfoglucosamine sulfohydrolase
MQEQMMQRLLAHLIASLDSLPVYVSKLQINAAKHFEVAMTPETIEIKIDATSRRTFLQGAMSLGIASTLPAVAAAAPAPNPAYPNIIYIHSHDSGRYLGPYGYAVPTPTLNKLATEGVLFRHAYSGAPTCSPSRACLLTGQCAHQNGMFGLVNMGFKMPDYSKHICHTLRKCGYETTLAGLQHIAPNDEMIGFDQVLPHKGNKVAVVAPIAANFLQSKPQQPFFLDCGFFETHRNYVDGQDYGYPELTPLDNPNFVMPPASLPDTPETRKDMAGFHASARIMDSGVGMVLAALEKAGLAENTLVISTTDHGISFPQMKCGLFDNGWGVSLIMRGPGAFSGGKTCDALISQLDIYPTICDYLNIEQPAWLEGKSFLPVLRGEKKEVNDQVFAEVNYHVAYEPKRAVRTARWKYIKRYDGRTTDVLDNCDDGLSKRYWVENDWKTEHLEEAEELFDLIFDPTEHNNLARVPAHQQTLQDMRERLQTWMVATRDPLLHGPIPLPPGARAKDPNDVGHEHS